MKRILPVLLCAVLLAAAKPGGVRKPATSKTPGGASSELARIVAEYERHQLEISPALRLRQGLEVRDLPDFSEEAFHRNIAFDRALLARLERIDPSGLPHEEWLTCAVLREGLRQEVDGERFYWYFSDLTSYTLPLGGLHQLFANLPLRKTADLEVYLRLLRQYPSRIGQLRTKLEGQRSRGILLPKGEIDLVVPVLRGFALPPDQSPLGVPLARLERFYPESAEGFHDKVARLVTGEVNPAITGLADALGGSYREQAPEAVGMGQYPGGPEAYRYLVRLYTGLDLTPEEIHQRGLDGMRRLQERMDEIQRRIGFAGTRQEFLRSLRTDPRFLAKTPDEVGERLMAALHRIEPQIPRWFLRQPRAPYGVRRLEAASEGSWTFGYYQQPSPTDPQGTYYYNGSKLDQRPLVDAAALIYHELLPGHHFQIALQLENKALPAFRRNSFPTAFVEGWGEYASNLGIEMGAYDDPYALYGRLAADMMLTTRLVVDTGMNALGWPRSRAMDLMRDNCLISDTQIETETLRYSASIPGQALAYKIGSSKIQELRLRAEKELGDRFDIRRFHDAVLSHGALPMAVLEPHIDDWISREKVQRSRAR